MCWFSVSPEPSHRSSRSHRSSSSSLYPPVEEIVRVNRDYGGTRFSKLRVSTPTVKISGEHAHSPHHHHHPLPDLIQHHHPDLHPHLPHLPHIHMYPPYHNQHHHHEKLHGPGRKRIPIVLPPSPPPPPPPTRRPSLGHPHSIPIREPMFHTQIREPLRRPDRSGERQQEIRETTRVALGDARPPQARGKLRRVAGYEVLGKEVPWDWDCVSSVDGGKGGGIGGGGGGAGDGKGQGGGRSQGHGGWVRRKTGTGGDAAASRFPPFGAMDRWF